MDRIVLSSSCRDAAAARAALLLLTALLICVGACSPRPERAGRGGATVVLAAGQGDADAGACGSLQALVDAAAPGATVTVPPCVYRESITLSRPITLVGQPGAEIRGSDVWATGWASRGGLWVHAGLPALPRHGECLEERPLCQSPYQLFLDGRAFEPVAARPGAGQFAVRGGTVQLADDPSGRRVEVSVRATWITGQADGVTIRGLTMRHAANSAQSGGLEVDGSGWTIQGNVLSESHGPLISIQGGSGHRLLDNHLRRGGELGIHGSRATDLLVQGNLLEENNLAGFDPRWEAGGIKLSQVSRARVTGNDVVGNRGIGIWCDIGCEDVEIDQNRVHDNSHEGISYEISRRGKVHDNRLWENGWGGHEWAFGAGVMCQNCADSELYGNVVAWSPIGLAVIEQNREIVNAVSGVLVRDNVVVCADGAQAYVWASDYSPFRLFRPGAGLGRGNAYACAGDPAGPRFGWGGRDLSASEFAATPAGAGLREISPAERDRILPATGIPLAPEPR